MQYLYLLSASQVVLTILGRAVCVLHLQFVAFAAYRCRLEASFLADELASATFAAAEAAADSTSRAADGLRRTSSPLPCPDFTQPLSMRCASQIKPPGAVEADGAHHHRHAQSEVSIPLHRHLESLASVAEAPVGHLHTAASAPGMAAYDVAAEPPATPKLDVSGGLAVCKVCSWPLFRGDLRSDSRHDSNPCLELCSGLRWAYPGAHDVCLALCASRHADAFL